MTDYECIDDIINQLRDGADKIDVRGQYELYIKIEKVLREKEIIVQNKVGSYLMKLTPLGHQIADTGLSYQDWLKTQQSLANPNINYNFQNATNTVIGSGNSQLDLQNHPNEQLAIVHKTITQKTLGEILSDVGQWIIKNIWTIVITVISAAIISYFGLNK